MESPPHPAAQPRPYPVCPSTHPHPLRLILTRSPPSLPRSNPLSGLAATAQPPLGDSTQAGPGPRPPPPQPQGLGWPPPPAAPPAGPPPGWRPAPPPGPYPGRGQHSGGRRGGRHALPPPGRGLGRQERGGGQGGRGRAGGRGRGSGHRGASGIESYFSPCMLENPWVHLEARQQRPVPPPPAPPEVAPITERAGRLSEEGAADRPWH